MQAVDDQQPGQRQQGQQQRQAELVAAHEVAGQVADGGAHLRHAGLLQHALVDHHPGLAGQAGDVAVHVGAGDQIDLAGREVRIVDQSQHGLAGGTLGQGRQGGLARPGGVGAPDQGDHGQAQHRPAPDPPGARRQARGAKQSREGQAQDHQHRDVRPPGPGQIDRDRRRGA